MRFNQICKIIFELFRFKSIRAAVKIIPYPPDGPGVRINGFLTLEFKGC
jgi:hypothetical protein